MLKGKTIIIGVTGSIAAYKIANLCSMLVKQNADVRVIMTKNATNFITPTTFETLTGNKCLIDTFDRNFEFQVGHVSIAKKADLMLIAPASANVIAKMAHGIADDMLTTTALAFRKKIIVAPAMNTNMFTNPITQDNIKTLKKYGIEVIKPATGRLACKDVGIGKMPNEEVLFDYIIKEIAYEKDLLGKNILVSAGATIESIDPVRYITNHSTGKMGIAIAKNAMLRGACVTLVAGNISVDKPRFVDVCEVESAKDMFECIKEKYKKQDIIIKAAAVADYTPIHTSNEKIKKSDTDMKIDLTRTNDILAYLGEHKLEGQYLCGFSMETNDLIENSKKKLIKKNADMIVANSIKEEGAGFATNTNIVTIITKDDSVALPIMSKEDVASTILDKIKANISK